MILQSITAFHGKNEDNPSIVTPAIPGIAIGTVTGTLTFPLAKFNKGSNSPAASGNYYTYSRNDFDFNPNNFAVDFWFDPNGWTVTDGVNTKGAFIRMWDWYFDDNNRITVQFNVTSALATFVVGGVVTFISFTTGVTFDSSLHHFIFGFKRTGIINGGGDTYRLYLDGNIVGQSAAVVANQASAGGDMHFHTAFFGGSPLQSFDATIDNLKSIKGSEPISLSILNQIVANKENENFPTEEPAIIPAKINLLQPEVLLDGIDIYKLGHIQTLGQVEENRTFQRNKLVSNQITQTVLNQNDFYSADNPESQFSGLNFKGKSFIRKDKNGEIIWDGITKDLKRIHGTKLCDIISTDVLAKFQKNTIEYETGGSGWENPADAALNILNDIGYPNNNINLDSFKRSSDIFDSNNILIKVNYNKSSGLNMQTVLNELGKAGFADVYSERNKINYAAWKEFSGGTSADLSESDLINSSITVDSPDDNIINEYFIFYDGSSDPATDSDNANPIGTLSRKNNGQRDFTFDGSTGKRVVIKDLSSAHEIGRNNIKRVHRRLLTDPDSLTRIAFQLSINNETWVDLQTTFRLSFAREGWTDKIYKMFSIKKAGSLMDFLAFEIAS